jgi:hypothetical protein
MLKLNSVRAARAGLWIWAVLLGTLLSAPPITAQVSFAEETADDIHVETTCILPPAMHPGLIPVSILIENRGNSTRKLDLTLGNPSGWDISTLTSGTIELEPGERRKLEWLTVYNGSRSAGRTNLRLTENGQYILQVQAHQIDSSSASKLAAPVLAVSNSPKDFALSFNLLKFEPLPTRATGCEAKDLPDDWRAYSTLAIVALDLSSAPPNSAQMEAILNWVSLGGTLILKGKFPQAENLLSQHGSLLEERFKISGPSAAEPEQRLVYRHMFGRIALQAEGSDLTPKDLVVGSGWNVPADLLADDSAPDGPFPGALQAAPQVVPGIEAAPISGLTALLILFAILIGPLQFFYFKRKAAPPFRFLVITPVLGLGFATLIVLYSLFSQGLDVKESVLSVSWLDQRNHDVATLAKRTTFSGSVFRNELRYTGRTAALPLSRGSSTRGSLFRIDMNDGGALKGDYLPVRVPTQQLIATPNKERGRLEFEWQDGSLFVVSGFDHALEAPSAELSALYYRDQKGDHYRLPPGSHILPHQRAELELTDARPDILLPLPDPPPPGRRYSGLSIVKKSGPPVLRMDHLPRTMPIRSYLAFLDQSPFVENGGVERTVLEQRHLLIGTLPELAP